MSCHINVTGGELEPAEINAYIQRAKEQYYTAEWHFLQSKKRKYPG